MRLASRSHNGSSRSKRRFQDGFDHLTLVPDVQYLKRKSKEKGGEKPSVSGRTERFDTISNRDRKSRIDLKQASADTGLALSGRKAKTGHSGS